MTEITITDIQKALDIIKIEAPTLKIIEFEFGWVEVDYFGNLQNIGLNEKGQQAIKFFDDELKSLIKKDIKIGKVTTLYGIPIVIS